MPSDESAKLIFVDKVIGIFNDTFGKEMLMDEKQIAFEHMGFFKIKYKYMPLGYDVIFENDRGVFSIEICDSEGAFNFLYRIKKFDSETTLQNIGEATKILKYVLNKNDFAFYITRDEKLYKKQNNNYIRVKDLKELM